MFAASVRHVFSLFMKSYQKRSIFNHQFEEMNVLSSRFILFCFRFLWFKGFLKDLK